jgi:hypothetical protein
MDYSQEQEAPDEVLGITPEGFWEMLLKNTGSEQNPPEKEASAEYNKYPLPMNTY